MEIEVMDQEEANAVLHAIETVRKRRADEKVREAERERVKERRV